MNIQRIRINMKNKPLNASSTRRRTGRSLWLIGLFFATAMALSCSKEEVQPDLADGKSTVVEDLAGDTGASVGDGVDGKEKRDFRTFLYSFTTKKQIWLNNAADSARYMKTNDWDIAFTEIYNSIVYVNNSEVVKSPGYGGSGQGAIIKVDKPYDEVDIVPEDANFENNQGFVGWQGWPQHDNYGWYNYSLNTHLAVPIKGRTFILKTATGKYAKLELINVYQGNPPVVTNLHWPAPYLTFRFFVQEDGSTNLKTR